MVRFIDFSALVFVRLAVFGSSSEFGMVRADLAKLDEYIELLYDEADKMKASALILNLCSKTSNLQTLAENGKLFAHRHVLGSEVLMGALSRVFREDSHRNFDLATNLASIFGQLSKFSQFHPTLSKYKVSRRRRGRWLTLQVGAVSLQLVENELKRSEQWHQQARQAAAAEQRKWELALRKEDAFVVECLKVSC